MADASGVRNAGSGEQGRWSLVKVFDLIAVMFACIVVVRAIGGILSALQVPLPHVSLGPASPGGLSTRTVDAAVPTYLRLEFGTLWADLISGLLLLAALGLLAVPRMVWDVPSEQQWEAAAPRFVLGVLVVAAFTTIAAVVGTVNDMWNSSQLNASVEALNVAQEIAAVALTGLSCALSWFALPFIQATSTGQPLSRSSSAPPPGV